MISIKKSKWLERNFIYFKWSVFALLFINMVLFFISQTFVEGVESLAWIALLLFFEWETSQLDKPYVTVFEKYTIHLGRLLAYVLILFSTYEYMTAEYISENGSLDMYNAITWLLIVLYLEYDVYFPGDYGHFEWILRNVLKVALYSSLFVIATLWWIDGEFLDFYDAVLWIVCFFFIELNIFIYEEEHFVQHSD